MQATFADLVHPILNAGISLRNRLDACEPCQWDVERAALKRLLARLQTDLQPDGAADTEIAVDFTQADDPAAQRNLTLETMRFALISWLDEFLGQHSSWGVRWRDETLEVDFYGSRTAHAKFWEEARYAETRGDFESLEVMYLCVMLGYRGDWRTKAAQIEAWSKRTLALLQSQDVEKPTPACLAISPADARVPSDVPYRWLAFVGVLSLTLSAPITLLACWRFLTA